jgi:hypothetical protein
MKVFLPSLSIDENNGAEKQQQQQPPNDLSLVDHVVADVNLIETASVIIPNESKSLSDW